VVVTSRPESGSSKRRMSGSWSRAAVIRIFCFIPFEYELID